MSSEPSLAAAAFRNGSPAVTRSFRFHRPRGAPCGRGWCGTCEVETAEGRTLACCTTGEARGVGPDLLRPFGWAGERFRPWFYERGALRHPVALHALRRLSAAPRLGAAHGRGFRAFREEELEVAVVGRGGNVRGVALGVYPERTLGVLRDGELVALRFERLVLDTEAYDRLPLVPGNDLPGVIGLGAFEAYAAQGAFSAGLRFAVWGPPDRVERAVAMGERHGLRTAAAGDKPPRRLLGRGRLIAVENGSRVRCDVFVAAVAQPALELAAQAGADIALSQEGLPILVARNTPDWLELRRETAAQSAHVADHPTDDRAFACFCEDVRAGDVRAAVAAGFSHPEVVKRRTGAMTGPCQGKLCAAAVLGLLREAGAPFGATTSRPPARAVSLADLAADA